MALSKLKGLEVKEAQELYTQPASQLISGLQIQQIHSLSESIGKIEKMVLGSARELPLSTTKSAKNAKGEPEAVAWRGGYPGHHWPPGWRP